MQTFTQRMEQIGKDQCLFTACLWRALRGEKKKDSPTPKEEEDGPVTRNSCAPMSAGNTQPVRKLYVRTPIQLNHSHRILDLRYPLIWHHPNSGVGTTLATTCALLCLAAPKKTAQSLIPTFPSPFYLEQNGNSGLRADSRWAAICPRDSSANAVHDGSVTEA